MLERAVRSLEEHLGQALDGVTGPFDRLERRALSYMRGHLNYHDLIHILYGEAVGGDTRFQDEFRSIYAKITFTLAVDVEQVAAPGELDFDPELLSYALVGAGEMLAYRISLDDRYDLETVVRNAFKLIRREPAVKSGGGNRAMERNAAGVDGAALECECIYGTGHLGSYIKGCFSHG